MASSVYEYGEEEAVTPAGRIFLHKEIPQVILCAVGLKHHLDVDAIKASLKASVMVKHPRFCSLVVRDTQLGVGVEHWRRTEIDIDRHVIVVDDPVVVGTAAGEDEDEAAVNEYLADLSLSSSGLDESKPLWELHILQAHKCAVLRVHHALGDGISLVSMFLTLFRQVDDPDSLPTTTTSTQKKKPPPALLSLRQLVMEVWLRVWLTFVYVLGFISRSLWVKDPKMVISGGDGVELWPRKLATARFRLDDMKLVKRAISGATINDVLFGVISTGLSRYLDHRGGAAGSMQITGLALVNLRNQPGIHEFSKLMITKNPKIRWGNRFGFVLLPLHYDKELDPLGHLVKAKEMLDRKKSSLEAAFSYWIGNLVMRWLGINAAGRLNKRIICNTTFTISNVVGPHEKVSHLGNPITYLRNNISSTPHALSLSMMSYAGQADLQILVAKDIIPDPHFLAGCFESALRDMKAKVLGTHQLNPKGD